MSANAFADENGEIEIEVAEYRNSVNNVKAKITGLPPFAGCQVEFLKGCSWEDFDYRKATSK